MMTEADIKKHNQEYKRNQIIFWVILFIVAFGGPIFSFIKSFFG